MVSDDQQAVLPLEFRKLAMPFASTVVEYINKHSNDHLMGNFW